MIHKKHKNREEREPGGPPLSSLFFVSGKGQRAFVCVLFVSVDVFSSQKGCLAGVRHEVVHRHSKGQSVESVRPWTSVHGRVIGDFPPFLEEDSASGTRTEVPKLL